jgi:PTS system fructose-specific IIB component
MNLVAVTACPTGIAHSQMAAENLEQTAERLGHDIKVEVQGAMGAENELSAAEIEAADAVIIASDTAVSRDRFGGKPLVKGTVKDGVNDPESLFDEAASLLEDGESGASDVAGGEDDAEGSAGSGADTARDTRSRGGDREKGLFARLKRLLS